MSVGVPDLNNAYKEAIKEQPLSRGPLNPLQINSFDKTYMKATFTLTNSVPQFTASNSGAWQVFETRVTDYAKSTCGPKEGTLYLLTGRSENGLFKIS